jgi:hypothetical protein
MQGGHLHLARLHDRDESLPPIITTKNKSRIDLLLSEYVTGTPSTEYISEETPMNAYANVHLALEKMRVRALSSQRGSPLPSGPDHEVDPDPPRVLVLGPENSGKTTVCKILANYAVRTGQGWTPMYVNTDPSEVGVCTFGSWVAYAGGK